MHNYCFVQVNDLQRKVGELKGVLDETCVLAESLVSKRVSKDKYVTQDKSCQSRINRITGELKTIVQALD